MLSDLATARICYGLQVMLREELGHPVPGWEDLPPATQKGQAELVRLARMGASEREMHQSWCALMTGLGWRYGPVRDAIARTHPMVRDWDDLDSLSQACERITVQTIRVLTLELSCLAPAQELAP
jgi:hypothetical protein